MDPVLSILGLVETLVGTMDFIISKARQVYHLKSKCEAFANLLDELQLYRADVFGKWTELAVRTLRNATLESIANEQAVQRLNKLNETLTRAGFLLTDLEKPMKWNFAVATGKADRKLDALHKEIMESLTLLNTHVLHGAPSPSQPPPVTNHHPHPDRNRFGLHMPFHANHVPTAYPSDPPNNPPSHHHHGLRWNRFSVLCPYRNPSAEYRPRV